MSHYTELHERATSKGITTFSDINKAIGMDMVDLTGDDDANEYCTGPIYNCDAAIMALETLAEEKLI
jgi:hypothetical protein